MSTSTITAWDTSAVSEFDSGNADILVLRRPSIPCLDIANLVKAVQSGRVHEYLAPVRRDRVGFEVRSGLGELGLKSQDFADDVITLVES
ncbi:MAG: hypothetical protein AAF670_05590, partial [Planctomycetota bacterium]